MYLVHYTIQRTPPPKKTQMEKLQEETADFLGENFDPLQPRNKNKNLNKNDDK